MRDDLVLTQRSVLTIVTAANPHSRGDERLIHVEPREPRPAPRKIHRAAVAYVAGSAAAGTGLVAIECSEDLKIPHSIEIAGHPLVTPPRLSKCGIRTEVIEPTARDGGPNVV